MQAWLRANQLWQIVCGNIQCPDDKDTVFQNNWKQEADRAAGWIYLMVEPSQTIHLKGIEDDPVKMWNALKGVHLQQKAGARYNAYDDLFSIRKQEEENLQSLVNRVDTAMKHIQNLRPDKFSLDNLYDELLCMTMIRALPDDYSHFVSSLMLRDKLDKATIVQAFHTEEIQRTRRSTPQVSEVANKAAAATTPTTKSSPNKKQQKGKPYCSFCAKTGHVWNRCTLFHSKSAEAKAATAKEIQESAGEASIFSLEELKNPFHQTN